jgi:peptidoglycan/LPS O-acetylase OafA/YrhL
LLILVAAVYGLAQSLWWPDAEGLDEFTTSTAYISNYTRAYYATPLIMSHSWSLAVEMHFYLAWSFILFGLKKFSGSRLPAMLFLLFLATTVWRFVNVEILSDWYKTYLRTDTRLSGLVFGAYCASLKWKPSQATSHWLGPLALICLLSMIPLSGWKKDFSLYYTLPVLEISTGLLLIILTCEHKNILTKIFSFRPFVWVGIYSYGLYLWHYPLARVFRKSFNENTVNSN